MYFGVDWDTHETARAARTYRSRPDVAAAVDAVFADVFDDPARGDAGSLSVDYPHLVPDRDPVDGTNVHVAAYTSNEPPGSPDWAVDEATLLARYLAGALHDGTLDTPDTSDDPEEYPGITVLFPRRRYMDVFAEKLEARGISVANASQYLFAHPLVRVVVAVVRWLVDPFDPERTRDLLDDDAFPAELAEVVAEHDWSVVAAADADADADTDDGLSDGASTVLAGLAALASRHARHASDAGALVVEDVVDRLSLAAGPLGLTDESDDDPARRVAALDALLDHVDGWEGRPLPARRPRGRARTLRRRTVRRAERPGS
ncbi:hypothetical protein [Halospeciosus flavus]|uniref:hypothetical protein n=1 Tax=Halospeciosus flavus TaxID=3032283 RepID=UPI0036134A7E